MTFTIEQLKKMKKGITPGEWVEVSRHSVGVSDGSDAFDQVAKVWRENDTAIIAATPLLLDQLIELLEWKEELKGNMARVLAERGMDHVKNILETHE